MHRLALVVVCCALSVVAVAPTAGAETITPALRNEIDTSDWNEPSPDPMGLTYRKSTNTLFVVDSEVDELDLFDGVNVWEITRGGNVVSTGSTLDFSDEPADIAHKTGTRTFFVADDDHDTIFEVHVGPDDEMGTSDDEVRRIPTDSFGSQDPEGLAYGRNSLFIADGTDQRVYRLRPGPNGRFDGAGSDGDDVVSHFGTLHLELGEPEGVEYQASTGHVFVVSRSDDEVVEATVGGVQLRKFDLDGRAHSPSDVTIAPGTVGDGPSLFVADRGLDNDTHPSENDGLIIELRLARRSSG